MKNTLLTLFVILLIIANLNAQSKSRASIGFSFNKIEVVYRYTFSQKHIWVNPFVGISNQDINTNFDDLMVGVKLGLPLSKFKKSQLYTQINLGIYFPNNNYYKATTPFVGFDLGYELMLGKTKKHSAFAEIGYLYGKKGYTQEYHDANISVKSTDEFSLKPITFNLGYGFSF